MPKFNSNGCQIYYETHGSGTPLVLINGLIADHNAWRAVLPALAERYRVITLDNRGTGQSDAPAGDYSVEEMAGDVMNLIEHLEIHRPVIVGHSLGGCVAQFIMRNFPEKVRAGVISSSFYKINTAFAHYSQVRKAIYKQESPRQLLADSIIPWAFGSKHLSRPGAYDAIVNAHLENPHYQTEQGYHGQCAAMLNFDSRSWLDEIRVRTLVLVGSHDIVALPEESFEIARQIPSAQIEIIEGAGHNPEAEESGLFIAALTKFVSSLSADVFTNPSLYKSLQTVRPLD
jgi:3-oxoadipate enol-lactonase